MLLVVTQDSCDLTITVGVRNQRLEYANAQKGKRNRLSQDRIEKLEAIGFGE